jgi:zinc/manganese transport system ATP-binding protein
VTGARPREEVLSVSGLSFSYGDREILRDVDFRVLAGEFTGLIGTNGSGKTTLFRIILGLIAARTGQVRIAGGRRSVGYVPQRVEFDPALPVRVRDLVALGVDGHRYGLPLRSAKRSAVVEEMMTAVDVAHLADRRLGEISGGELQRTLIAHALVSRPRLLVLDEPLANLDPGSVNGVVGLLDRVAHQDDVAVLLSAHEMNALLPVMDRVVYVANGRAASGTTDEVVRADVLSALYGHHVDVVRLHGRVLVVAGEEDERLGQHEDVVIE